MRVRLALVLVGAVLAASGCAEAGDGGSPLYEPSKVRELAGGSKHAVTFTGEGASRTGLATAPVRDRGGRRTLPYEALIYDGAGDSWVYVVTGPLTFVRRRVAVDRVVGGEVLFTRGPSAGTPVVTVGATEVYGSELGIEGSH
jgi:hypothetical protein